MIVRKLLLDGLGFDPDELAEVDDDDDPDIVDLIDRSIASRLAVQEAE